jgi:ABC-type nitrate/sulfonate/bicarbonate transport system substrate-binding protein
MGGQPQIVAPWSAAASRAACCHRPPITGRVKLDSNCSRISRKVGLDYPTVSLVSTRSFIKKDPQTVRRFMMAYSEGVERLYRDKEFTMKVIGKYTKTDDREALDSAYGFATTFIERPPHLPYKAVETILAQLGEKDPKAREAKAEEFIDPTFYNEMEKSATSKASPAKL